MIKRWIGKHFPVKVLACFISIASFSAYGQLAGPAKLIPIAVDDITIFVPQVQCTSGNVCVSWVGTVSTKISTPFTPVDPQFDTNLDANKINRLSVLNVYSPSTDPLILQCQDAAGNWQTIQSTGGSASSTIGAKDANGAPLNFNFSAAPTPVFEQRWLGSVVANSNNCLVNTVVVSTKATTDWTYKHFRKSANFRVVTASGTVASILPSEQEACRLADASQNLWQRSLNCNTVQNVSFQLDFDEYIERTTNYGRMSFTLNGGNTDKWVCDYLVSLDNQPLGVNSQGVQQVFGKSTTDAYSNNRIAKGAHTLKLTMTGTCAPTTRNCSVASWCVHNTNIVQWSSGSSGGGFGGSSSAQRTDGAVEQIFNFTIQ